MEFRILGPVEVEGPGGRLRIRGDKMTALLGAFLSEPNRMVSIDRLMDAVWGEDPTGTGLNALHVSVSRLRKLLTEGDPEQRLRVVTHATGYQLRIDPGELDLEVFRRHVQRGRAAATEGRFETAADAFAAAVAVWRGPALATVQRPFAAALAAVLEGERLDALEWWIEARLALGQAADLIPDARNLVNSNPLRERLSGLLMLALYRTGRQAEALETFRDIRAVLIEELGIEPGPELQLLHQRILSNDPVIARGEPRAAPRLPQQLPADVATFVGRETEIAELAALLTQPTPHTMVITVIAGTAGVGKTALAVHWAHQIRERFPDGQLYVDFHGYASDPPMAPTEALARFLRALGVPPTQVPVDLDEQSALYRSLLAGKHMLVLLDNVADVGQVRPLLPGTPTCVVMTTSRNDLRGLSAMHDARRLSLDALTSGEAVDLLANMVGEDRVAAEPDAARAVTRLCGRLPLALRIAAANLADRPGLLLADAATELADGNPLRQLELPGDPELAVRSAFGHSYTRLDPASQRLFGLLGGLPGPDFSSAVVAAMAELSHQDAVRGLERLAVAHLIEVSTPGRYRFHDLLRHYARERVAADASVEHDAAVGRLLDWYLQTAYRATGVLNPHQRRIFELAPPATTFPPLEFAGHEQALAWCETERANLVAAVRCAAEVGQGAIAWRLAASLWWFFLFRRHVRDWRDTHETGLAVARGLGDRYAEAWMLNGLGGALRELHEYDESVDCCRRARTISRDIGDRRGESANLHNLGEAHHRAGRFDEAVECCRQALSIRREVDDRWGEAADLTLLAELSRLLGRFDHALDHARSAVRLWREAGVRLGEAAGLNVIGEIHRAMGRFREAIDTYRQALAIRHTVGDQWGEGETLDNLGQALLRCGRVAEARDCWRRALAIFTERRHPRAATVGAQLQDLDDSGAA
ncbi:tetratricopeptide repeat protein [Solihabitans fulvus]|uniref:Tetratricopeptide repeat protein n=1 Tax=Solihabitans fulvus TaxID=1892852 RepID=A0A5B2XF04_9PSEU|nr:BTAD domain-containing putative transcriptional regulator [Solihabitans fulvus]KAA2261382.1 tetratricopeptide repeat protein [Solihabitans fulvus]